MSDQTQSFRTLRRRIRGPVFPIPTPFTDRRAVDIRTLGRYVDFLIEGGARILQVGAHASRFDLLTTKEMKLVNATVARRARDKNPDCIAIAATPSVCSTATAVDLARDAEDNGASVIGTAFPEASYTDRQILQYFEDLSRACNLGILIDGCTLPRYPTDLLGHIAALDEVVAVIEDSTDDAYTEQVVSHLHDQLAIIVSGSGRAGDRAGGKAKFLKFHPRGSDAYVVGIASFWPTIALDFYRALEAGDLPEALGIVQNLEHPFFTVATRLGWHTSLKSALQHLGLMTTIERPPLQPLDQAGDQEIAACLATMRTDPGSVFSSSGAALSAPG